MYAAVHTNTSFLSSFLRMRFGLSSLGECMTMGQLKFSDTVYTCKYLFLKSNMFYNSLRYTSSISQCTGIGMCRPSHLRRAIFGPSSCGLTGHKWPA